MKIYSYIVSHDSGFAPNPFHGYCTLACCKPVIRRCASVGDWIVGLSPKRLGNDIVFVMKVTEKLSFADYWKDKRFKKKRAKFKSADLVRCAGDNIYQLISASEYLQKPSFHSNDDGTECTSSKIHDLNGQFVLISDRFSYFGSDARNLPANLSDLGVTRGHKRFECAEQELEKGRGGVTGKAVRYFEKLPRGIIGNPRSWESHEVQKKYCPTSKPKSQNTKRRTKGRCKPSC